MDQDIKMLYFGFGLGFGLGFQNLKILGLGLGFGLHRNSGRHAYCPNYIIGWLAIDHYWLVSGQKYFFLKLCKMNGLYVTNTNRVILWLHKTIINTKWH